MAAPPALPAEVAHLRFRADFPVCQQVGPLIAVAIEPPGPDTRKKVLQFPTAGPRAQGPEHVPAEGRKEAGEKTAVGGETGPYTPATEQGQYAADHRRHLEEQVAEHEVKAIFQSDADIAKNGNALVGDYADNRPAAGDGGAAPQNGGE